MSLVCTPQATWVEHGFVYQAFPSLYMKDLGDGTRQVAIINIVQFK